MQQHSKIRHYNHTSRKRQKGMGLIEFAIYLALAAAILFGVFYLVGVVQGKRITNNEVSNVTMMASDLRTKFTGQSSFAGITPAAMIALNIVPKPTITSGFSTPVTVAAANINGVANDGFTFTYQVPSDDCSNFVSGAEGAFSRIAIAGTNVKNVPAGDNSISVAELASCGATATGNANVTIALSQGR